MRTSNQQSARVKDKTVIKTATFDIEGLTEKQLSLAKQFIDLLKEASREQARREFKNLFKKISKREIITSSEEEAEKIANEAVASVRGKL